MAEGKGNILPTVAMKQNEEYKRSLAQDMNQGIDEGKAQTLKDTCIFASDEIIDHTENSEGNGDQQDNENAREGTKHRKKFINRRNGSAKENPLMSQVPSIFDGVVASAPLLINGRLLAVKPFKKAVLFIVLILLSPTATSPINPNSRGVNEYKLLQTTSNCDNNDLNRFETCEKNEEVLKIFLDFCGFSDLCDPGFKPVCVFSDDGEKLYICSPEGLTCQKGYRKRVWRKSPDSDVVFVQEEKCPHGRYRPNMSDCNDECAERYESIKDLPAEYALFSKGDNISPPLIYCDFERGFYQPDGNFLLKYDEEIRYNPSLCISVYEYNPCSGGLFPIPNGTCVTPCEGGWKRDIYDDFKCKVLKGDEIASGEEDENVDGNEASQTTEKAGIPEKQEETDIIYMMGTKAADSHVRKDWHVTAVVVLVCATVLLAIAGLVVLFLEHKTQITISCINY